MDVPNEFVNMFLKGMQWERKREPKPALKDAIREAYRQIPRSPTLRAAVQSEQKAACKCGWVTINKINLVNVDCPIHGTPLSNRSDGG